MNAQENHLKQKMQKFNEQEHDKNFSVKYYDRVS